ncbi:hypothetical protein EV184_11187 [Sinorhizobium americanum]|uniref:Uncharacterized protein n=1 Tax=Sinorhizobium americanum TaxID=194963 RepID=A0A4R2BQC4_9HYPH|nr:hypothetical protein EV184_11187 [Sinorhizobium americanum]
MAERRIGEKSVPIRDANGVLYCGDTKKARRRDRSARLLSLDKIAARRRPRRAIWHVQP